jgi:hypothetical protein
MTEHPLCPICQKGHVISLCGLLVCGGCRKAWVEHEFLADVRQAGSAYYFTPDINGTIVIYDPKVEKHEFIEPVKVS